MFVPTLSFRSAETSGNNTIKPITQQIFESRMHLSRLLVETGEEGDIELSTSLRDILHKSIDSIDKERFQVAMNLRHVDEFEVRGRWNNLDSSDVHVIEETSQTSYCRNNQRSSQDVLT
jgi:type I restriction enzyme R subunit